MKQTVSFNERNVAILFSKVKTKRNWTNVFKDPIDAAIINRFYPEDINLSYFIREGFEEFIIPYKCVSKMISPQRFCAARNNKKLPKELEQNLDEILQIFLEIPIETKRTQEIADDVEIMLAKMYLKYFSRQQDRNLAGKAQTIEQLSFVSFLKTYRKQFLNSFMTEEIKDLVNNNLNSRARKEIIQEEIKTIKNLKELGSRLNELTEIAENWTDYSIQGLKLIQAQIKELDGFEQKYQLPKGVSRKIQTLKQYIQENEIGAIDDIIKDLRKHQKRIRQNQKELEQELENKNNEKIMSCLSSILSEKQILEDKLKEVQKLSSEERFKQISKTLQKTFEQIKDSLQPYMFREKEKFNQETITVTKQSLRKSEEKIQEVEKTYENLKQIAQQIKYDLNLDQNILKKAKQLKKEFEKEVEEEISGLTEKINTNNYAPETSADTQEILNLFEETKQEIERLKPSITVKLDEKFKQLNSDTRKKEEEFNAMLIEEAESLLKEYSQYIEEISKGLEGKLKPKKVSKLFDLLAKIKQGKLSNYDFLNTKLTEAKYNEINILSITLHQKAGCLEERIKEMTEGSLQIIEPAIQELSQKIADYKIKTHNGFNVEAFKELCKTYSYFESQVGKPLQKPFVEPFKGPEIEALRLYLQQESKTLQEMLKEKNSELNRIYSQKYTQENISTARNLAEEIQEITEGLKLKNLPYLSQLEQIRKTAKRTAEQIKQYNYTYQNFLNKEITQAKADAKIISDISKKLTSSTTQKQTLEHASYLRKLYKSVIFPKRRIIKRREDFKDLEKIQEIETVQKDYLDLLDLFKLEVSFTLTSLFSKQKLLELDLNRYKLSNIFYKIVTGFSYLSKKADRELVIEETRKLKKIESGLESTIKQLQE